MTYQRYCEDLNRFNQPITLSEDEFNIKYAKPIEPEKTIETRRKEPTLKLAVSKTKAQIKKPPKPINGEIVKKLIVKSPLIRDRITEKPRNKTGRIMTPKISYDGMSVEDIKAHKAKLAREWRAKRKEAVIVRIPVPITDEDRQRKREYYQQNSEKIKAKTKAYRQRINSTKEGRAKSNDRIKEWRKNNPEKAREIGRKSKARCRERQLNGNNNEEG